MWCSYAPESRREPALYPTHTPPQPQKGDWLSLLSTQRGLPLPLPVRRQGRRPGLSQALSGGGRALQALEWRGNEFMGCVCSLQALEPEGGSVVVRG